MKLKRPIDLHKGLTAFVVVALMFLYGNFTVGPWVYLALHGTYGVMWVFKSAVYPDRNWEEVVPLWKAFSAFGFLLLYWAAPFLLISGGKEAPLWLICLAVSLNVFGTLLHFGSDAQKYYTLRVKRGLILDGFFARTRNPNYLGEFLIYASFAALSMHWFPWIVVAVMVFGIWVPNMLRKDRSLSRHPEWEAYKRQAWIFFPKPWR